MVSVGSVESIPFLLPNETYIFHTYIIPLDTNNIHQYHLTCYLYQTLSRMYDTSKTIRGTAKISNWDDSSNTFIINNIAYTPLEAMESLVSKLPSKDYIGCQDSPAYRELLEFVIWYSGLLGILTSTRSNIRPATIIPSPFWYVENQDLESCKPKYHMQVIEGIVNKTPLIVTGGTGTGKTQVIPKLLYYYYNIYNSYKFFTTGKSADDVILALPRVFLAKNIYSQYNIALGYEADESTKSVRYPEYSPLVLKAEGKVVKAEKDLIGPKFYIGTSESFFTLVDKIGLAMIDEFHEHDLKSDILFSLLYKQGVHKVVITATPSDDDNSLFPKFMSGASNIHIAATKIFQIKQSSFSANIKNYLEKAIDATLQVTPKIQDGEAVLVFLPLVNNITTFIKKIKDKLHNFLIVEFHSAVSDKARYIIAQNESTSKMLIVATQAAESSVTFKTLVEVIDAGLEIRIVTTPVADFRTYDITPKLQYINQYQYLQRRGRVGRKQVGSVIVLYDPETLSKKSPNLLDSNLTILVLLMKKFNLTPEDLFVVLTPEKEKLLRRIIEKLEGIKVDKLSLLYIQSIYWIESIHYYNNPLIPDEDKELYLSLWEQSTYEEYEKIFNRIQYPSFIPRRRLIFSHREKDKVFLVEDKTRVKISLLSKSFKVGRIFYDQVSLYYTIGV